MRGRNARPKVPPPDRDIRKLLCRLIRLPTRLRNNTGAALQKSGSARPDAQPQQALAAVGPGRRRFRKPIGLKVQSESDKFAACRRAPVARGHLLGAQLKLGGPYQATRRA